MTFHRGRRRDSRIAEVERRATAVDSPTVVWRGRAGVRRLGTVSAPARPYSRRQARRQQSPTDRRRRRRPATAPSRPRPAAADAGSDSCWGR